MRIDCQQAEPLLDLTESIRRQKFLGPRRRIARGDVDANLSVAAHRLSGVFTSGGQEQFYLESQAAIAYPGEQGQMVVHSSTQNPTEIQARRGRDAGRRAARGRVHLQADGRRVRRQGIAGRDPGDDGRARGAQDRPAGPRHLQQRRRHARSPASGTLTAASGKSASTTTAAFRRCASAFYSNGGASTDLSLAVLERIAAAHRQLLLPAATSS